MESDYTLWAESEWNQTPRSPTRREPGSYERFGGTTSTHGGTCKMGKINPKGGELERYEDGFRYKRSISV